MSRTGDFFIRFGYLQRREADTTQQNKNTAAGDTRQDEPAAVETTSVQAEEVAKQER